MTHTHTPQESHQSRASALIVGIDSQIGDALFHKLSSLADYQVFGTSRRIQPNSGRDDIITLDLCRPELIIEIEKSFDHVIFCAGVTNIADCEADPAFCRKINVDSTTSLIRHFIDLGSHVVFLSSNAVFDGLKPFPSVYDHPNPLNNYGKFKWEVEEAFRFNPGFATLRLTKVITSSTPFINRWMDELDHGQSIKVFEDRLLSPVGIEDVTENIHLLMKRRAAGTFHFGGIAEVSYADYAHTLFSRNPRALSLIKIEKVGAATQTHNSLATFLPTLGHLCSQKEQEYASSSISFVSHRDDQLLEMIRSDVSSVFTEQEEFYISLATEDYRELIKVAQDLLNANDYVVRICKSCEAGIKAYIEEDRFYVQSNLYLRATRPMTEQVSEHIGWHRETFYGPNMEKSINLWTPLKGVDRFNTLRFIPESQLIPDAQIVTKQVNDDHTTKGSTGNKVGFLYAPKVITGGVDLNKAVPMLVPKDHTAIFSGNLIHGAASNCSQTIRFSIDFRIMPFSAYNPLLSKEFHLTSGKPYFLPY